MLWYERYSPGRLIISAAVVILGGYLFGFFGPAPSGPVAAFFITVTAFYFAWVWLGPLLDEKLLFPERAGLIHRLRDASSFSLELRQIVHKRRKHLDAAAIKEVEAAIVRLESAMASRKEEQLQTALANADKIAEQHFGVKQKGILRDFVEGIGGALIVALLLRVFVVEAFKIPSGSMIPTLEIGDHIFVNKFNYGIAIPWFGRQLRLLDFSPPEPGDVIVFISPPAADNAGEDFIKRVVAGPGQEIRLVDGQLVVDGKVLLRHNGGPYMYEDVDESQGRLQRRNVVRYIEEVNGVEHAILLESVHGNNWPRGYVDLQGLECNESSCRVKQGYVFCMGDNRDKSSDSRFWGAVPLQNIKGKAMFVWMSFGGHASDAGFLGVRWQRLGTWIE